MLHSPSAYLSRLILTFVVLAASLGTVRAEDSADTATIAVASNFATTAEALTESFEQQSGHRVVLVRGSSGKLFAQIVNGAPIDVFLSADRERPALLEARGLVKQNRRATYALGELVIWSRQPQGAGKNCLDALLQNGSGRIAIANPLHAPYGKAAMTFLQQQKQWQAIEARLVYGENVAQALHFAASGNADFGVVARAQLAAPQLPESGCVYVLGGVSHPRVHQDAVLLQRSGPVAAAFMDFLFGDIARGIIASHGYRLPDGDDD